MADDSLERHLDIDPRFPDLSGEGTHGLLYGERDVHGRGAGRDLLPGGTFPLNQVVGELNICHERILRRYALGFPAPPFEPFAT